MQPDPPGSRRTKARQVPGEQYLSRRQGSAHWQIVFRLGHHRVRESAGTENRTDAAALAYARWREVWAQVHLGEQTLQEMTLADAFVRYFEEVGKGTRYGERSQRYNMNVLAQALGHGTPLSQLTDQKVNAAVQWLRARPKARKGQPAKLTPATVNRYLTTLSVVCKRAAKLWGVKVGPWVKAAHMLAEPDGREVFLDHDQARALVAAAVGHLRPILLLDLMTGLRRENVVRLAWETVSLDLARAVLVQKGNRRLTVSLSPPAVELLRNIEPDPDKRRGAVFRFANPNVPCACPRCTNKVARYAGQPIRSVKRAFATARAGAKLDDLPAGRLRFHDLRHTYASWLLAVTGDLVLVQKALGHVAAAIPEAARHRPFEIWWQDEARIGQQGSLTYTWGLRGSRPAAPRDTRYDSAYLFGAVCPDRGVGAALVLPSVNIEAMNLHLAEIGLRVAPGAHAVVVLDGAGWHQPGDRLKLPANVSLLHLPPYSPQLNPVENVWQFLRQNYLAHRVLDTYDDIVQACCDAWNALTCIPSRIRSIASRSWAQVSG